MGTRAQEEVADAISRLSPKIWQELQMLRTDDNFGLIDLVHDKIIEIVDEELEAIQRES